MKFKLFICLFIGILFCSCVFGYLIKPIGFKYKYDGKYTGIDTLINIEGYYRKSNQNTSAVMFYRDGLACCTYIDPIEQFRNNLHVSYNVWGTYKIENNSIIECQFVSDDGLMAGVNVYKATYAIIENNSIIDISSEDKQSLYSFHPLENRIDSTNWLLKKKWFWKDKNAYKKRKKE